MRKPLWDKRFRRRLRTSLLAVVATGALFWGAIDIVGVPAWNMARLFAESLLLIGIVIFAAALTGWLLHRWRGKSSD
ncbi:hypothetical protein N9C27_04115 [Luminiphilus sp.]|nr:hypothetical protein [Luminiphilus sp.]MDB4582490.1 hypothetical protein [Draconibacterium sp.]MDG2272377.1 hypothetical protein [Halioglobus sp.]MDA8660618.1 hypothetical protein [Luminiphilus sp.]MDA9848042.1 hypothetical protein [Luminiphilus sp.]